ncbi:MAG: Gfo/Idh/MocA family oxidoreductase [Planctomycetota bacterium]|nr:Gfo/Idh/MocA family oxidoreductase [Planctomycetota bacterium]
MSDPIRYGIVGLGRAGWDIHVRELRPRADAKIVAVADPVAERRDQAAAEFGCKTYANLSKLLKQDDVDVVVIATPSVSHAPDTKRALAAGKHVIVEKPMAMSVAEADSMIAASEAAGKKLFVHQNYRFRPEFTHLRETIDSGILGRVYHIRQTLFSFVRRNDWQTLAKNGGGVLNNTCPHFIDQLLQLMGGRVTQVMGDLQRIISSGDVEDHVKAFMRSDTGCTADMEVSTAQHVAPPPPKWTVCGTSGTLVSDGKESTIRWFDPTQVQPLPVVDGPAQDRKYGNADTLPWQEKTIPAEGSDKTFFYDNVFGVLRRGESMRVTPESVREVIRVIGMIRKGTKFPGRLKPQKAQMVS